MTQRSAWATVLALAAGGLALLAWSVLREPRAEPPPLSVEASSEDRAEPFARGETSSVLRAGEPVPSAAASDARDEASRAAHDERELAGAIWVEGRVVFAPGTPSDERAEVVARGERFPGIGFHRAPVAADGTFRVAFHPETRLGRVALKARYAHCRPQAVVGLKRPDPTITLEPELGAWLTGVLLPPQELRSDDPRPEAIHVVLQLDGSRSASATPAADGTFAFDLGAIPADVEYEVVVQPGVWIERVAQCRALHPAQHRELELPMRLGAQVRGRVVGESGEGLAGKLDVSSTEETDARHLTRSRSAEADADGRFAAVGITPGRVQLHARADGYVARTVDVGTLGDRARADDVVVRLERGLSIEGLVRWPDGSPAFEAELSLATLSGVPARTAVADDDGRFAFRTLRSGTYRVRASVTRPGVSQPGAARVASTWSAEVELAAGTIGAVLELDPGLALSGTVVDERGELVDDFAILVGRSPFGNSTAHPFRSAGGRFRVEGLHPGDWLVSARGETHVAGPHRRVTIEASDEIVDLVTFSKSVVTGTVVDAGGEPVRHCAVRMIVDGSAHGLASGISSGARTGADGTFEVTGGPGAVELRAEKTGFLQTRVSGIELAPGERRDGLVLRLGRGGRLEGRVVGLARDVDARVVLRPTRSAFRASRRVSRQGRTFAFQDVAPDTYRVELRAEGLPPIATEAEVVVGETTHVTLEASAVGLARVHGLVRRAGEPVGDVTVEVRAPDAPGALGGSKRSEVETRSDGEGRYELLVRPGPRVVEASPPPFGVSSEIDLPPGGELRLDFDLPTGGIHGVVVRADGRLVGGTQIHLWHAAKRQGITFTSEDGEFQFGGLPAGTYALSSAATGLKAKATVELDEGETVEVDLVLEEHQQARLSGRVVDAAGRPVIGASVRVHEPFDPSPTTVRTDGGGRYLARLDPGEWSVEARTDERVSRRAPVTLASGAEQEIDLVLEPGTRVSVVLGETSGPTDVALVDARENRYGFTGFELPAGFSSVGLGPVPPGTYRVLVRLPGGEETERTTFTTHGEPELVVDLTQE